MSKYDIQELIAKRAARTLKGPCVVNLGIGIPTLVSKFIDDENIFFHTENGLLGVCDVEPDNIDPNLVNAGKLPVGQRIGASFFNSADSFGMIRGGHVDVAILGVLQVDQTGLIANWAVPGKNIMGVGGAMDLLVGAKKVIVTTTHTSKDGKSKILKECTYPITSTRNVDMIITELAVFEVQNNLLKCIELMPGVTIEEVRGKTEAEFIEELNKEVLVD
ncbi:MULTISPECIES: 3-oxoacid CoA-transferase subunit B [Peribacillus]|uniref:3-oxoacid CoA-transferase subunit B n=1 Tax=Peribacillus TaxID=2675229 RepID=UPI001F4E228D|nr:MULTISPECIES: 3-oxoacid CoA-transferase subunit B [unclassified Peribacillus]MCK1983585.1 3-oxoacid CoA-transferase subunit B [Peribacillus sp. Aquil_B1]MCK2006603.1 3-oxoacid CoA-transferase subunit B [Peribacillus sp. Aquil_B8]